MAGKLAYKTQDNYVGTYLLFKKFFPTHFTSLLNFKFTY